MGMGTANARKYALKHEFQFVPARMPTRGGRQEVIALPKDEGLRLVQFRKDQGFPLKGESDGVLFIRRITP